jgi:hypothetical protein
MEIYKKLRKHSSILLSKKTVVFIVNYQKQIFTEFSDNTKIISLKKYIQHNLNNKYIDILYNGHTVKNDWSLSDLCRDNQKIKRLFFTVVNKKEAKLVKDEEKKAQNYEKQIMEMKNNNYKLNNELLKLQKEDNENKLKNKNSSEKCKSINKIYIQQEEEINKLTKELSQINENIDVMSKNLENSKCMAESRSRFEISSKNNFKKANSIVHLETTYTIKGKNSDKSLMNTKKQTSAVNLKKPRISGDNTTINTNTNNVSSNNSEVVITTSNKNITNATVNTANTENNLPTKTDEENDQKNNIKDIIDKNKEIINKGYNPKFLEINFKSIDKDLSLENNPINDSIKKWFTIFQFLDLNDQLLFSSTNKQNDLSVLFYWMYYLNYKIKKIDDKFDIMKKEYIEIHDPSTFALSRFTKTAFKMLNNANYSKAFENSVDYFKDEKKYFLSIYKLLFQIAKILEAEDIVNMDEEQFLNKMIEIMKTRNGKGGPLGNYVQNIITNNIDLSFENILKVNEILKKYNIDKINTNEISKMDKTTGVISMIIKDVIMFMGFYLDEKNKDEKLLLKNNLIIEFQNIILLKESYKENIDKIKKLISNISTIS